MSSPRKTNSAAGQGFFWWEIDMTYYLLVVMSWLGIVRDLRPVPEGVLNKNRIIAETSTQMLFGG